MKNFLSSKNNIPVVINNYNRLECLQQQVKWFESYGFKKLYIIDNDSNYGPLLDYYKKSKHFIFRLDKNVGHTALWDTHLFLLLKNSHYIYTDPDIIPVKAFPKDFIQYFKGILTKYPQFGKIGPALKIDDLPDYYPHKKEVIAWEKQYWEKELEENVYDAIIDTTFALYLPNRKGDAAYVPALRIAGKFEARHLPWYQNPNELSQEDLHYIKSASSVSSWTEFTKGKNTQYQL
ncbi:MAG: glycosyltransferase family 2 protein [Bacteroidetes bacterium]|nr:glycosyltransferase family 2 protein [Bacteroidota bacterium]